MLFLFVIPRVEERSIGQCWKIANKRESLRASLKKEYKRSESERNTSAGGHVRREGEEVVAKIQKALRGKSSEVKLRETVRRKGQREKHKQD